MTAKAVVVDGARSANVGRAASVLAATGALLLPKCPLCFVAYASALSAMGLHVSWWAVRSVVFGALAISVGVVLLLSAKRRDPWPPLVGCAGVALFAAGSACGLGPAVEVTGAGFVVAAAWLNAFRCRTNQCAVPID